MKGFYNKKEIVVINKHNETVYYPIEFLEAFQKLFEIEEDNKFPLKAIKYIQQRKENKKKNIPYEVLEKLLETLCEYYTSAYQYEIIQILNNLPLANN